MKYLAKAKKSSRLLVKTLTVFFRVPIDQAVYGVGVQCSEGLICRNPAQDVCQATSHRFYGGFRISPDQHALAGDCDERGTAFNFRGNADTEKHHVVRIENGILASNQCEPIRGERLGFIVAGRSIIRALAKQVERCQVRRNKLPNRPNEDIYYAVEECLRIGYGFGGDNQPMITENKNVSTRFEAGGDGIGKRQPRPRVWYESPIEMPQFFRKPLFRIAADSPRDGVDAMNMNHNPLRHQGMHRGFN